MNVSGVCLVKIVYLFVEYYMLTRAPRVIAVIFSSITFMFLCTDGVMMEITFLLRFYERIHPVVLCFVHMMCLFSSLPFIQI